MRAAADAASSSSSSISASISAASLRRSSWARGAVALFAMLALAGCESVVRPTAETVIDRARDAVDIDALRPVHRPLRVSAAPTELVVIDVAARGLVWSQELLTRLRDDDVDLLILGELHDNPDHHALQAWITEDLSTTKKRADLIIRDVLPGVAGLAFEMLPEWAEADIQLARVWPAAGVTPGQAEAAADRIAELVDWENAGWPPFEYYRPILLAAPTAYVAAAGVDREQLRAWAAAPETAPEAMRYGLDRPLDPEEQARREAGQIAAHCDALPAEAAPSLVAAQRVRDARLAAALLRASSRGTGFAILIAGSGHARLDWGAPRFLRRVAPDHNVVSIAMVEDPIPAEQGGSGLDVGRALDELAALYDAETPPFDYVIVTPPIERPDPCAAFRR